MYNKCNHDDSPSALTHLCPQQAWSWGCIVDDEACLHYLWKPVLRDQSSEPEEKVEYLQPYIAHLVILLYKHC